MRARTAVAWIGLVIALTACGNDDPSDRSQPSPEPSPSIEETDKAAESTPEAPPVPGARAVGGSGLLRPGTYFTDVFEPQAVFKVGEGWDTRFHGAESLELRFKPEPRDEVIFFDSERFDLSVERALRQIKTLFAQSTGRRSDFAFREVPSITPERLGGSAFRIEVRVEQPVSVLLSERNPYQVRPGDQLIVNGIDSGKGTVLIFVEAPGETFERFMPKAAQVLATLRFP